MQSVDCVVSIGAISRATSKVELVTEAYRMLRPGGLFVFVEPDGAGDTVQNILNVFPEKITSDSSAGAKIVKKKTHTHTHILNSMLLDI